MSMYGSIHTHFESRFDTGNDLEHMVLRFVENGAKKVAVTEHGVFTSFEDLNDIVNTMKKKCKALAKMASSNGIELPDTGDADVKSVARVLNWHSPDVSEDEFASVRTRPRELASLIRTVQEFSVIPGVEGYFGENNAHLILIAKDYEGYQSLCRIITESNESLKNGSKHETITLENLKRNVAKGHVICTSACIGGPFGHIFGLKKEDLREKIDKLERELEESGYLDKKRVIEAYEMIKADAKAAHVTKKEEAIAKRNVKKFGDDTLARELEERAATEANLLKVLAETEEEYKEALAFMKGGIKRTYSSKETALSKAREELRTILDRNEQQESNEMFENLTEIFGRDNFYFEIQNHGMEKEATLYNKLIQFAASVGHMRFVASNDVHIGTTKQDADYEDILLRRNVIKFTRFNKYTPETEDDREYTIKSDEELREELLKIVKPAGDMSAEQIVDSAIGNIETLLAPCEIQWNKEQHYPKFCENEAEEFERRVRKGLAEKFPNGFPDEKVYNERLEYELGIVKKMGYAGYHLIVQDYLTYGRLLGYLPTEEEVRNAPNTIEELDAYITEKGYPRIGYHIGPGRGSGAGSLCCFGLGITDIDPIPYNLLFERFLNPSRVSMPDIDSDFSDYVRDRVIEYCKAKYGEDCVCKIVTKAYGAPKGNLRLAARYMGDKAFQETHNEEVDRTEDAESDPDRYEEEDNFEKETESNSTPRTEIEKEYDKYMRYWYSKADKLSKAFDELNGNMPKESLDEESTEIVKKAEILDGVFTNYGQHAAGVIISKDRLSDIIPLMWNASKGTSQTQCVMGQAEAKGLLKMDFLGLNNLNIISEILRHPSAACVKNFPDLPYIKKSEFVEGTLDPTLQDYVKRSEMLKDPAIYRDIFAKGLTQGVFQFESDGMKKMLMEFQPECFEDLILLVSAYRPGPMDYIPEIIARKHWEKGGRKGDEPKKTITIKNDDLDGILSATYGCPIYQEQIMQIFQRMAGYSLGDADLVRRAMSKKKEAVLKAEKAAFIYGDEERGIEGCIKKQGLTKEEADELFEQMMPFAKYGFNKSHATAYALVAMFTAYLKKYHTADFFRSSLNYIKELKEIPPFVAEMSQFGLSMLPPTFEESEDRFTVSDDGKGIRFGLKYVKGFSSQEGVARSNVLEEFISMNPGISTKQLVKYAQIGLFTYAFKDDVESGRCRGNRHEVIRVIETYGELMQKYYAKAEALAALREAKLDADRHFAEEASEESEKEVRDLGKKITTAEKDFSELSEALSQAKADSIVISTKETSPQILENRGWETEFLSLSFDTGDSLQKVKNAKNERTFEALRSSSDKVGRNSLRIPCVVLSISGEKKTKTSGRTYYEGTLMDRTGAVIKRRFDRPIERLEGEFDLALEDKKFFTCDSKGYNIIPKEAAPKEVSIRNAGPQERAKLFASGKSRMLFLTGSRAVTVVEKAEDERTDDCGHEM